MSSLVLSGDTSGTVSLSVPAVAGTNTLTIQAGTGTNSMNTLATAVASTSGTSIDFTGLPSWVKRITVMMRNTSLSGTSDFLLRLGTSSGVVATGYVSAWSYATTVVATGTNTTGIGMTGNSAAGAMSAMFMCVLIDPTTNSWVCTQGGADTNGSTRMGGGSIALASTLDRVRITTVNGTDTFDAGSVNILYEG